MDFQNVSECSRTVYGGYLPVVVRYPLLCVYSIIIFIKLFSVFIC